MDDISPRINEITNQALARFGEKHQAREQALRISREVVRSSANAIRAVHRNELENAQSLVRDAGALVAEARELLRDYPDLYFTGYTQDSQKEYTEASAVYAFIAGGGLPGPDDLGVETAPYLNGLESPADGKNIIRGLIRRGYADTDVKKLVGGNALEFFRRVIA